MKVISSRGREIVPFSHFWAKCTFADVFFLGLVCIFPWSRLAREELVLAREKRKRLPKYLCFTRSS